MSQAQNTGFQAKKLGKYYFILIMVILPLLYFVVTEKYSGFYDSWNLLLMFLGVGFSCFTMGYFLFVALLAYCYKPAKTLSDAELPGCTVIVPAYNEGKGVLQAIESLIAGDYPAGKLEIIAVDDGSKDDTRDWVLLAQRRHPEQVSTMLLDRNQGKKNALYLGFKAAKHEIVVTVDSDSEVLPDAVRKLVGAFGDAKVGGVAGNIRIGNIEEGPLVKMLDVAFAFGFEFMRSAQSFIGSVLCTPGALSAYRRSAVLPILDVWLEQTFMGQPATIGEDRALSSLLIRSGYKVLYQSNAYALTRIPSTYVRMCRMLIRWTRSDIRENLAMTRYAFGDIMHWNWQRIGLQINLVMFNLGILLPVLFLPTSIAFFATHLDQMQFLLSYSCVLAAIWAVVPAMIYANRYSVSKSLWAFAYGVFGIFFLTWVPIYSLFTVKNSSWMTRELDQQGREKEARKTAVAEHQF